MEGPQQTIGQIYGSRVLEATPGFCGHAGCPKDRKAPEPSAGPPFLQKEAQRLAPSGCLGLVGGEGPNIPILITGKRGEPSLGAQALALLWDMTSVSLPGIR